MGYCTQFPPYSFLLRNEMTQGIIGNEDVQNESSRFFADVYFCAVSIIQIYSTFLLAIYHLL